MINAAIAGIGRWGRNLVTAIQGKSDKLRFTHGVARNPERVRDFAEQHGITLSTEYERVLADPRVQAIVLTTPHSLHTAQVIAAAEAGKAVFCEKPLALMKADALRSLEACRRSGVVLGLGHDKRFFPSMRELKRVTDSGILGTILHIEGHFSNESTRKFYAGWREHETESPGGGITATGIHIMDAFINLIGPMRQVNAQLITHPPAPDPVDTLSVLIEFGNKVSGVLCGVRTTPQFWRVHVFGTDGSAEAVGNRELIVRTTDAAPRRQTFGAFDTLRYELDAFADAIEGKAPYPIPAEQMIANIAALEATLESIKRNAPVQVQ